MAVAVILIATSFGSKGAREREEITFLENAEGRVAALKEVGRESVIFKRC